MQQSNPKNRLSDEDLHKKYNEYKEAFALKQLKTFFESHKKEEWFLEKYHPKYIQERAIVTKELKKDLYKQFISDLKEGLLDKINNDTSEDGVKQEGLSNFFFFFKKKVILSIIINYYNI
jgi:hypothetical protein